MNEFHLHLVFNHFPIVGAIFSSLVLLTGILLRTEVVKRVAYALFVLTALLAVPTNNSGEEAEHKIKKLEGVNEVTVEKHEEMASIAFWASVVIGLLSVIAFVFSLRGDYFKGILSFVVFAASVISIYYLWQAGETGGKIRHPEIIQGVEGSATPAATPAEDAEEEEE